MWKGIALVLCLCMLPTVAFATGENTVSISYETPSAPENVKVTVELYDTSSGAVAGTDVTILALRRASTEVSYTGSLNVETIEAGPAISTDAATLQKQVAYIDQEASGQDGTVSFEFVPASFDVDYASKFIDIYVGGKDVSTIKHMVVERANQSPTIALDSEFVWYKGDPLVLTLSGAIVEKPNKEDLLEAWAANAIALFEVTDGEEIGTDGEVDDISAWLDAANNMLVIPADVVGGRTISSISFVSGTHTDVDNILAAAISETDKTAGTATLDTADFVDGTFTATYNLADNVDDGFDWVAAAVANGVVTGADVADSSVTGAILTVAFNAMPNDVETKEYAFAIEVEGYTTVEKTITATAPTKTAIDALTALPAAAVYTGEFYEDTEGLPDGAQPFDPAEEADKKNQMWGKQTITLEDTIEDGLTIAWQVFKVGSDLPVEGAAGVYPLARSWTESVSYKAVATISMDGYKTMTREFAITGAGAQLGVDGVTVNVTVNFEKAGAAAAATVTLGGYTLELSEGTTFTADAVIPAEYNLTVARPGYVAQVIAVKVQADGAVTLADDSAFAMDAMVAGDIEPDGKVDSTDFTKLNGVFWAIKNDGKYIIEADLNGDNKIDSEDFVALNGNFWYGTN